MRTRRLTSCSLAPARRMTRSATLCTARPRASSWMTLPGPCSTSSSISRCGTSGSRMSVTRPASSCTSARPSRSEGCAPSVLTHVLKRLALGGPVLLGITLILFVAIRLLPGDPAVVMAGDLAPGEYVERLRRSMGLDKPVYIQYVLYLGRVVRGDLGRSSKSFRPVADEIRDRYPYTLQLAVAGMAVAAVLGISAGAVSAVHRGSLF